MSERAPNAPTRPKTVLAALVNALWLFLGLVAVLLLGLLVSLVVLMALEPDRAPRAPSRENPAEEVAAHAGVAGVHVLGGALAKLLGIGAGGVGAAALGGRARRR